MQHTGSQIERIIGTIVGAVVVVGLMIRALKRSEDSAALLCKWVLSSLVLAFLVWDVIPSTDPNRGGISAIGGLAGMFVSALVVLVIWRSSLASFMGNWFASLYDGGLHEVDPSPAYSIAKARINRGDYSGAVAEIRKQLVKFPKDFEGQLMLAEIQACHLNDVAGAEVVIHRLCAQPGYPPRQIALALNTLADWHLKFDQDRDSARRDLEQIMASFPNSELAVHAAQRIAHLADTARLVESHEAPVRIPIPPGIRGSGEGEGLLKPAKPVEMDPAEEAAGYVRCLEAHPLDAEARTNLAVLYADHYHRLDLAADQLEQLIACPGQPSAKVVRWLNLLADLQIRLSAGPDAVRQTLGRISELYPGTAADHLARNRIDRVSLEIKGRRGRL
jgi:tetratricopeptide (TPR) repeat protein